MELLDTVESVLRQKMGEKKGGVWGIAPEATVYEALVLMAEKEIGSLLVMSGDRLVGLISERDYARKIALMGRSSKETTVAEVMEAEPVTVSLRDTVSACMEKMTDHRRRHLPVVEGERVIGVLSIGDLVNWIVKSHEQTIQQLHGYIAGAYPA
jgi:signal-transduction protein with cAMP-binding, CBS, and nucleotidyltransferase domain